MSPAKVARNLRKFSSMATNSHDEEVGSFFGRTSRADCPTQSHLIVDKL